MHWRGYFPWQKTDHEAHFLKGSQKVVSKDDPTRDTCPPNPDDDERMEGSLSKAIQHMMIH